MKTYDPSNWFWTVGGVNTFGGGANYFPGNAAGTTAAGAQYA